MSILLFDFENDSDGIHTIQLGRSPTVTKYTNKITHSHTKLWPVVTPVIINEKRSQHTYRWHIEWKEWRKYVDNREHHSFVSIIILLKA